MINYVVRDALNDGYAYYTGKQNEKFARRFLFKPCALHGIRSNDASVISARSGKAVGSIEIQDIPQFMNGEVSLLRPIECWYSTFSVELMQLLGLYDRLKLKKQVVTDVTAKIDIDEVCRQAVEAVNQRIQAQVTKILKKGVVVGFAGLEVKEKK